MTDWSFDSITFKNAIIVIDVLYGLSSLSNKNISIQKQN